LKSLASGTLDVDQNVSRIGDALAWGAIGYRACVYS